MSSKETIDETKFKKLPLVTQCDEVIRMYDNLLEHNCGQDLLNLALLTEEIRQKWHAAEEYCVELQEKLTKTEAERNCLITKLKMARNQISVEIEEKQIAEQARNEKEHQLALVKELLYNGSNPNLSEEQHKKLDFLNATKYSSHRTRAHRSNARLQPIDETGSFLSDCSQISFDETYDDLDSSQPSNTRPAKRSHAAAQQRALAAAGMMDEHNDSKRIKADEEQVIQCIIDGPATLEVTKFEKSFNRPVPHQGRRRPSREHRRKSANIAPSITSTSETDTGLDSDVQNFWPDAPLVSARAPVTPVQKFSKKHKLVSKQCVITKETCKPCGRRIQFGKKAMKCSDCRVVAHVECVKKLESYQCDSSKSPSSVSLNEKITVADYLVNSTSPQIPPIIYHTIQEIERRGLNEEGLYRVPGSLREVREMRGEFMNGRVPQFEGYEVHALCSLVKEFLRTCIKEPILTYSLRPEFVRAATAREESGLRNAINELPNANRDTLIYILMHLQRVMENPTTRMGLGQVGKSIGPSLVGYASDGPDLQELQEAPKVQETVLTALLQLPNHYYRKIFDNAMRQGSAASVPSTPESNIGAGNILGPIHSPKKDHQSSSLAERAKKYLGTPFGKNKRKENYFPSPGI